MVDYPPRIVARLSPLEPNPAPVTLRAVGLNKKCHFQIVSETVRGTVQGRCVESCITFIDFTFTDADVAIVDTQSLQVKRMR